MVTSTKKALKVLNLGIRSFADGLRTQEIVRERIISKCCPPAVQSFSSQRASSSSTTEVENYENVLILMEHRPVYTAGES